MLFLSSFFVFFFLFGFFLFFFFFFFFFWGGVEIKSLDINFSLKIACNSIER